ncbi:hypothetical protein GPK80_13635 [Coprococcus comes]|uniref:DUF7601 domain-containing protein n=1 Tax=Lachnospiraceae TaxID=186803 RepID=UPI001C018E4F|nr:MULTISPECIES: DUF5979 domain-containing protein [Lachnospiraceae]MBT9739835.1 hypothetical protein [Dorea formicigenerans]MBT9753074.1 hypothetical protein [Coprococcus comes]
MSMNKMFKKVLAVVAAGAMTMGMAMPTFAAEGGKVTEAYVSKTYNTEVGKAEKFSFTATQVKAGTGIITTAANVTIPDISFTAEQTGTTKQRAKVNFPTFTEAGEYEYTVTETQTADPAVADGEHEKIIMSKAEYTMDVYVTENTEGNLVIDNIIVKKMKDDKGDDAQGTKVTDIGDTDTNGFNFTNTYVQEAGTGTNPTTPDPDYKNYGSLNVSKTISVPEGVQADANKEFDFTATFKFPDGTDANALGGVKGNGTDITLKQDGTYTFKLKTTEKMKFTGVPVGTKISVTESATPNYKGSAAVVINGAAQDTVTASKYDEAITVSEKSLGQKKNTVDVTNTYNYVPTTGIIMNTLPYVLMIALCGVALIAFVGFKRRRLQK